MSRIVRRQNPPALADYRRYKPYLRIDLERRCAYCHVPEVRYGPSRNYAVDHFRPKSRPEFAELRCYYPNLYYACHTCNRFKHHRWPSAEEQAAGRRFLDPCAEDTAGHFRVMATGELQPLTAEAQYTCDYIQLNREFLREWRAEKRRREAALASTGALLEEMKSTGVAIESAQAQRRLAAMEAFLAARLKEFREEFGDWWN